MKKALKIITCLILFNINIVNAMECEDLKMYADSGNTANKGGFVYDPKLYMLFDANDKNETYWIHNFRDSKYQVFSIYCRNAGWSNGKEIGVTQTYECTHKVFDSTSDDEKTKIYDAGIAAILKNGYSTINTESIDSINNLGDDVKKSIATTLALRVYELLSPLNTNANNDEGVNKAHKYVANKWLSEFEDLLRETLWYKNETYEKNVKDYISKDFYKVTGWKYQDKDITEEIESSAKELLKTGLEAAKYYKENGAATLNGVDKKPVTEKKLPTTSYGVKYYNASVTYTFEADNFKSDDASIKFNFTCNNCSRYGVTVGYEVKVDGKKINNYNSNVNVAKHLSNGSGKIEFIITFSANSSKYSCNSLNYNLDIEWKDETINVEAFSMRSTSCSQNSKCQEFYMLYAADVSTKKKIEGDLELCSLSCKELESACNNSNNKNSDACKKFVQEYNSDCAECTTYINNAECSKYDSNIDIVEGYDVDSTNCSNINDDNNLNVLECIINNKDDAGNSYKATDLINNEFCSVYCKEDYHITLPGQKDVNSGRYFSLEAKITGTKTCYTSLIDENNTFEDKLDDAREKVIDAWNTWNKWKTGTETGTYSGFIHRAIDTSCNEYSEPFKCTKKNWKGEKYETTCWDCLDQCDCRVAYSGVKKTWSYLHYYYNGSYDFKPATDSNDGGWAYCSCHEGDGQDGTEENVELDISANLKKARSALNNAIDAYTSLINQYNACSGTNTIKYNRKLVSSNSTGWIMNYNFNPTVSFWYEESYMNNVTDTLETIGSTSTYGFKQQVCTTDTDDSYEKCSDGWKTRLDKSDTTPQFVCKQTSDGYKCDKYDLIISKAKYVKQEKYSIGNYITPTQFYTIYPSGAIVVAEAGKEDQIENSSELTNLLPVGLGTSQGVYTYALKITDLGEYYNKSKLGRLWGDNNSVVVNVLEKVEEGNSCTKEGALTSSIKLDDTVIKNGVYVCSYKVNCPNCPVECDDTGCKNPYCPENNCSVECNNCVYNNSSINIKYKPISSGNVNPSNRLLGINWSISTSQIGLKAKTTIEEIEKVGEKIYDINFENTSSDNDFAMKITLDSTLINKIKTYNDKHEDDGGYANNTLKCYDYTQNGIIYDNIYCYSTFIDELLYEKNTKDKIKIVGNRIIGNNAESSDNLRKTQTQTSGYWTTWAEASPNNWKIITTTGLDGIGPSWK